MLRHSFLRVGEDIQQQYHVVDIPQVQLGQDLGLGRRASWAVLGIGAWVHGMVPGILGLPYL